MFESYSVILTVGLLISLDNLRISFVLGTLDLGREQRRLLPRFFGLFEGLMPLVGAMIGSVLLGPFAAGMEGIEVALLLGAGLLVLLGFRFKQNYIERLLGYRWVLIGLPLMFSLDNLLAGISLSTGTTKIIAGLISALAVGAVSGIVAAIGIGLGYRLRQRIPDQAPVIGGSLMLALGLIALFSL